MAQSLVQPGLDTGIQTEKISRHPVLAIVFAAAVCLLVVGFAMNPSMPWESDQPAKAAQIMEVAKSHDYTLAGDLPNYFRLQLFPFYYAASGLLYALIGGDIFAFMNGLSVVMGVVAGVSLAWALYRSLGISPLWTALVLIAMPLFVITYSYGNEVAWSMTFFVLSLALVTSKWRSLHYLGGTAVAISLFCRPDMVLLAPYWLAWTILFCKTDEDYSWFRRVSGPVVAFLVTALALWLLLLRTIPHAQTSFEFPFNIKLIIGLLSYPFNPSVVLLAVIGWLILMRRRPSYAWAHLLLLVPLAFYVRNLASPKYIVALLVFYGLPAAYLLHQAGNRLRVAMVAFVAVWFFFGVSIYGVFGPQAATVWYLPTADGPCPIGGYADFYARARAGDCQFKQVQHIHEIQDLVNFVKTTPGDYWLAGHWATHAFKLTRARGEFGTSEQQAQVEAIRMQRGQQATGRPGEEWKTLMLRSGYSDLATVPADFAQQVRTWLAKGQVAARGPRASEALPTIIELGEQIPEGTNNALGARLLFVIDHYRGHMIFELPGFIAPYRATSWLRAGEVAGPQNVEPIHRDEQFVAFDRPTEGAKVYGYVWPARYYGVRAPTRSQEAAAR